MFYAEIDKNGFCFHITQNKLPISDSVLLVDENVLGKIWDGEKWNDDPSTLEPPEPTQMDRIENALNALTADSLTISGVEAAILEGVNEI